MNRWLVIISTLVASAYLIFKLIFDIWINKRLRKRDSKKHDGLTQIDRKQRRADIVSIIAFFIILVSSFINNSNIIMEKPIAKRDFETLQERVKKLEDILNPPGGTSLSVQIQNQKDSISRIGREMEKKFNETWERMEKSDEESKGRTRTQGGS